ncbi:bifunctional acetate--CoA ligase family protein/GNAT family N-acetyltransferase [Allosalinactinospora lopnorensis]|uniref:bifunctional acetate--CoA ligase family protein/GNAT family N-acetyltransferase n=1 Tax=Allosalinactinospora lopnorensis TaxID=1352348 RepID=UPI001F37E94F|nr:bifunctional GNAT family N-acetyltransferase/acetate--CoA ligase family protein [Allosalinactinospora lopnorensis]
MCAKQDARHRALLAVLGGEIVGAAGYEATDRAGVADAALAVADHVHGRGVGTLLLEYLASLAREHGFTALQAEVLASNHGMLRVFADAGMRMQRRTEAGVVETTIPLDQDDHYLDALGERESRADRESMRLLLRAGSVVVVGGTRRAVSVGNAILRNIRGSGYGGRLYAVHPSAASVADVAALPSVAELPEAPDLAVIAVPPDSVLQVARACGERGVGALVVITAGLDPRAGRELLAVCREHGMRLVGPNCFGAANMEPEVRLHATFAARAPASGRAGIVVQSGGVGIALLDHLSRLGIGVSSFLSAGNKLDVSSNDMLAWWESDPETAMALVHVESFGNPRKFSRLARRLGRRMPVLTVLAGRSASGQRAAASHTAAAVTPALTTEALFRQAGVTATRGIGELVGTAALFALQPLPTGPRVAIITNAGGAGVLAADACADAGLEVCELRPETRSELERLLPADAACANPVDTTPSARTDQLRACLESLAAAPEVDAVIAIMVRTALADPAPTVLAAARGKPVIAVAPDQAEAVTVLSTGGNGAVPSYGSPEGAAVALGHAWERTRWLARPTGTPPAFAGLARQQSARIVRDFLAQWPEGGWLPLHQAMELLECYSIPVAPWRLVRNAGEAARAARELGVPVALKADVAGVVHKKRAGALRLDLSGADRVREAYDTVTELFREDLRGVVVQAMAPRGFEVLLGVAQQPVFGPLVVCGLGGTYTEALRTRSARLAPLTDLDAAELVRSVRAIRELGEHGGEDAVDPAALADMALRLSWLTEDLPEVAELDMNPVVAGASGAVCVDVRVRLTARPHGDPYLRALRPF